MQSNLTHLRRWRVWNSSSSSSVGHLICTWQSSSKQCLIHYQYNITKEEGSRYDMLMGVGWVGGFESALSPTDICHSYTHAVCILSLHYITCQKCRNASSLISYWTEKVFLLLFTIDIDANHNPKMPFHMTYPQPFSINNYENNIQLTDTYVCSLNYQNKWFHAYEILNKFPIVEKYRNHHMLIFTMHTFPSSCVSCFLGWDQTQGYIPSNRLKPRNGMKTDRGILTEK